jgi:hypothetical protein
MTDAKLRARLERARMRTGRGAADIGAGEGPLPAMPPEMIEELLKIPEQQRLDQVKALTGAMTEALVGTMPGWTSPASPVKPPEPITR